MSYSALKHGARAAQRAFNENKMDKRCGWVKRQLATRDELLHKRSVSLETCDPERLAIINRAAFKTVYLEMREASAQRIVARGGEVPSDLLGKDYFTAAESLRRDLMALQMLDDRHAKRRREGAGDWTQEPSDPETDEQQATH